MHKPVGMIAVFAVPLNHRDLYDVIGEIDGGLVAICRQLVAAMFGNDLAGQHPNHRAFAVRRRNAEMCCEHVSCLDAVEANRGDRFACGKQVVVDDPAGRQYQACLAVLQRVDHHQIGAPARSNEAAIAKAESLCSRNGGGAIDGSGSTPLAMAVRIM